ncbi:MAG: DNA-binding protein [Clostridia bacterium]|nr:DNA-binding protein [Clostridia bacterium]
MPDNVKEYRIPRMRTVKEAAAEIKKLDANTAVTEWHIRQLAVQGVLPRVQAGKKLLINFDSLLEYLENPTAEKFRPKQQATRPGIRPIH